MIIKIENKDGKDGKCGWKMFKRDKKSLRYVKRGQKWLERP